MKQQIYDIKKLVYELEKATNVGQKIEMGKRIDQIIDVCKNIKGQLEEKKKRCRNIKLESINKIHFIYKPILKKNYYEGTYLEDFSKRRTFELKETKTLDIHNKFWQNHEIRRGNVFGSIPLELINKNSANSLESFGWDKVLVEVLEIKEDPCSLKEILEFCELNYTHFLMVKEQSTGAELILHYHI